jgi:hypothetical protein
MQTPEPFKVRTDVNGNAAVIGPDGFRRNFGKRKAEARKDAERRNAKAGA